MPLTSWQLTRTSVILWEGDSLSDQGFPYQMLTPLWEQMRLFYNPISHPNWNGHPVLPSAGLRTPIVVNKAINGSRLSDIASRIPGELATMAFTHVVICAGTNERTILRATSQANIATIAASFTTQKVLWIGPYAWGEKWPSGTNNIAGANDTRLDETDVDIPAGLAAGYSANSKYVSLRSTLYASLSPGPGADIDPYTVDGAHWAPPGRVAAYAIWSPSVSFT